MSLSVPSSPRSARAVAVSFVSSKAAAVAQKNKEQQLPATRGGGGGWFHFVPACNSRGDVIYSGSSPLLACASRSSRARQPRGRSKVPVLASPRISTGVPPPVSWSRWARRLSVKTPASAACGREPPCTQKKLLLCLNCEEPLLLQPAEGILIVDFCCCVVRTKGGGG